MELEREDIRSELKRYSLENWGQMIKISSSLPPDIFPHLVSLPKNSDFFRSLRDRVYRGRRSPQESQNRRRLRLFRGVAIEHQAVLAANDLGELMVSKAVFEGSRFTSLANSSKQEYNRYFDRLQSVSMPPGCRIFGLIHSHPVDDVANQTLTAFFRMPKVDRIPVSWSQGDFRSFLQGARHGHGDFTATVMINATQISFMIATEVTVKHLEDPDSELNAFLSAKSSLADRIESPPYYLFKKHGILLYAGNYFGKGKREVVLERLL